MTPIERSAQRDLNPRFRHGEAVGSRYLMGTCRCAGLSRRGHRVGIEPTSPPDEDGVSPLNDRCLSVRFANGVSLADRSGSAREELNLHLAVIGRLFCR